MRTKLQDIEWKEFLLKDIFPDIQRGKRLKNSDHINGDIPYVSSSFANNGVDDFVKNDKNVRTFSDCLTIANSGSVGACFYQPFSFVASDHVTRLQNDKLDKYSYLFIATIMECLKEKYSFNREINDRRIMKEKIILPVDSLGQPHWEFMREYMKEIEKAQLKEYKNYYENYLSKSKAQEISANQWKQFKIKELFRLKPGKSHGLNHLSKSYDGINYLGATNLNNGVLCQVERDKTLVQKGNCIAFIRNGEGSMGYSVYKSEDFIATSDMTLGYNNQLNRYIGTFITTVADQIRGKYNFGYKRNGKRLENEIILLPTDENGNPDYKYMENYMKMIEAKQLNLYLNYLISRKRMSID